MDETRYRRLLTAMVWVLGFVAAVLAAGVLAFAYMAVSAALHGRWLALGVAIFCVLLLLSASYRAKGRFDRMRKRRREGGKEWPA